MSNVTINDGTVIVGIGRSSNKTNIDILEQASKSINDCIAFLKDRELAKKKEENNRITAGYSKQSNSLIDTIMRVRDLIPEYVHMHNDYEVLYTIWYSAQTGRYDTCICNTTPYTITLPKTMAEAIRDKLNNE
jgi:hypothetical protein